ncbi:hypothetical protein HYY72_05020 [Candidatus Woesearchaeota archaeon]|nr:hypothetical protein [Candidatus Woesearchaeota archaeon]
MRRRNGVALLTNKKAATTEVLLTILRIVLFAMFMVFIIWFIATILGLGQPNEKKVFGELMDAAENLKENEPFETNLNLNGYYLYGFGQEGELLKTMNGDIEKPDTPECRTGACACMCKDKACTNNEELYCRSVSGIKKYRADSDFNGANLGLNADNGYFLALDGSREKLPCVVVSRFGDTITFSHCSTIKNPPEEDPRDVLDEIINTAEKSKDNEPFRKRFKLGSYGLYGFSLNDKTLKTSKGDIKKPYRPICNVAACVCVCKEKACTAFEDYCSGIVRIQEYLANSDFGGANTGSPKEGIYSLAIEGESQQSPCMAFAVNKKTMTFYECGS